MTIGSDLLATARAEALFANGLSTHSRPTGTDATRRAVRIHGGIRGCVGEVAAAYGEYREIAAPRMRWARSAVADLFSVPRGNHPTSGRDHTLLTSTGQRPWAGPTCLARSTADAGAARRQGDVHPPHIRTGTDRGQSQPGEPMDRNGRPS